MFPISWLTGPRTSVGPVVALLFRNCAFSCCFLVPVAAAAGASCRSTEPVLVCGTVHL